MHAWEDILQRRFGTKILTEDNLKKHWNTIFMLFIWNSDFATLPLLFLLLNLLLFLFQPSPPNEVQLLLLSASDWFGTRRALLPLLLSVLGALAVLTINCAEGAANVETQPTHGSTLSIYYKLLRSFFWAYLEIILEKCWMARFQ